MKKNSIPQLVELAQNGNSNAFELLFSSFKTRLHHSLFKVLRNYHETEDIVQQAFLRAWEKIGTFKGNSSFYTWLYRIGFNLAIDPTPVPNPTTSKIGGDVYSVPELEITTSTIFPLATTGVITASLPVLRFISGTLLKFTISDAPYPTPVLVN